MAVIKNQENPFKYVSEFGDVEGKELIRIVVNSDTERFLYFSLKDVKVTYKKNLSGPKKANLILVEGNFDSKVVQGNKENNVWKINIPNDFNFGKDILVRYRIGIPIHNYDNLEFNCVSHIPALKEVPVILFRIHLDGFAIVQLPKPNNKFEYKKAIISKLPILITVGPGNKKKALYDTRSMVPMTTPDFEQFAVLRVWSLLENIVQAKEVSGKKYLENKFQEMKDGGHSLMTMRINMPLFCIVSNMHSALTFLLPDPEENYNEGKKQADILFDSSKSPLERGAAALGVLGYSILTVVDVIPGVGKVDNALKLLKKSDDGVKIVTRNLEKSKKQLDDLLSNSGKIPPNTKQKLQQSSNEMQKQIDSLKDLSTQLNHRKTTGITQIEGELIQDSLEALNKAKTARKKAVDDGIEEAFTNSVKLAEKKQVRKTAVDEIGPPKLTQAQRQAKIAEATAKASQSILKRANDFEKTPAFRAADALAKTGDKSAQSFINSWKKWKSEFTAKANQGKLGPAHRGHIISMENGKLKIENWKTASNRAILKDHGTPSHIHDAFETQLRVAVRDLRAAVATAQGRLNALLPRISNLEAMKKAGTISVGQENTLKKLIKDRRKYRSRITRKTNQADKMETTDGAFEWKIKKGKLPKGWDYGHQYGDKLGQKAGRLENTDMNRHRGRKYNL